MPDPTLRPPQQRRSRESLARVLEAGTQILTEDGLDAFTLQEVSRRARVSIGSIYARFPNKEALSFAIYEHLMERIDLELAEIFEPAQWHDMPLPEVIRGLVRRFAAVSLTHSALLRVFMLGAPAGSEMERRASAKIAAAARQFRAVLLSGGDAIPHADPQLAVDIAFRIVFGSLSRRVTLGSSFEAADEISDETFVRELQRVVVAYLTTPA